MYRSTKIFWGRVRTTRANFAGVMAVGRGGEPPRAMRRGGASREARRPTIAPYRHGAREVRTATAHSECAQPRGTRISRDGQAAHRAVARRRDGDIAPYRNGARAWDTATGHECGARAWGAATGHEHGTRAWSMAAGRRGGGARQAGAAMGSTRRGAFVEGALVRSVEFGFRGCVRLYAGWFRNCRQKVAESVIFLSKRSDFCFGTFSALRRSKDICT